MKRLLGIFLIAVALLSALSAIAAELDPENKALEIMKGMKANRSVQETRIVAASANWQFPNQDPCVVTFLAVNVETIRVSTNQKGSRPALTAQAFLNNASYNFCTGEYQEVFSNVLLGKGWGKVEDGSLNKASLSATFSTDQFGHSIRVSVALAWECKPNSPHRKFKTKTEETKGKEKFLFSLNGEVSEDCTASGSVISYGTNLIAGMQSSSAVIYELDIKNDQTVLIP